MYDFYKQFLKFRFVPMHYAIIFLILNTIGVYGQTDEFPQMLNCPPERLMKEKPLRTSQSFTVFPRWSKPNKKNQSVVYSIYKWSYTMVQLAGSNEVPIDVTPWLSSHGAMLTIPEYGLTPGHYKIFPSAKPLQKGLPGLRQKLCHTYYKAMKPVVIISGGSYKMVPSNTKLEFSGEESFNLNTANASNAGFLYEWTCKQQKPTNFCAKSPLSTTSRLTIPAKFAEVGEKFEVTLKITTPKYNPGTFTAWDNFTQTIEVLKDAAQLEIACRKNCPPAADFSNPNLMTFLAVQCLAGCQNIKDEDYEWTIEPKSNVANFIFDYQKDSQFGRNNPKIIILKDVLKPGEYSVSVRLKDTVLQKGRAVTSLKFPGPPKVQQCQTNPGRGDTITLFYIGCAPEKVDDSNFYELYARNKKDSSESTLVVDGFFPYIAGIPFMLPRSDENIYFVRVTTQEGTSKELPVNPKVEPIISKQKNPDKFMDGVNKIYGDRSSPDSISNKVLSEHKEERALALQRVRSLVNEIVSSKFKQEDKELSNFVQDLKFRVVEDMMKAPIESINEVIQMTETISNLVSTNDLPQSDPLLAKFTTTICKKMIDKHVELVRKEKFPLKLGEKTSRVSNSLSKCLEVNTNPNFEVIKSIDQNVSTEVPVFDNPVITEHYDNYVDFDEKYHKNLELLKESTYNIINATALSAKVLAMTTAVGEKFVETFGKKSGTIVAKDFGKELAKSVVRSQGVTLIPSQDFANDDHPYDILLSTWSKDIMWWNPGKTKIVTDIANIEFWHSTCKEPVKNFTKPVKLFFKQNKEKNLTENLVQDKFVVPEGYGTMSDEKLNYFIKVRRVTLPKGWTVYAQFHDIQTTDSLDVVITRFRLPTTEDFANSSVVKAGNNSSFAIISEDDFDIWCYVGVLANKNSQKNVHYKISFVFSSCVRWIELNHTWVPACKPGKGGNVSVISCECTNFSVIAGYVQNVDSNLQEIIVTELVLVLQSTYLIFVTLVITFGLYCFLLLLTLTKRRNELYYLADNNRKHRFAYIVVIRTGSGRYASTTSNVIIRLVGTKKSSDAHVLNYPDPKLRLLQKFGTDMFLMTTANHLGDVIKVELWFDCIGPNPDWYCKDILVYDMQCRSEYYFHVNEQLTVTKGNTYVSFSQNPKVPKKKFSAKLKFENRYHTWHLWQDEETFCFVKKLSVILSTILMTCALALVFHGVPDLHLKDCLDKPKYHVDAFCILVAVVCSFPAFMVHFVVACGFRSAKVQYSRHHSKGSKPFCVTATCWMVLITSIVASTTFLIVAGFWVPYNQSLIWLTSCIIGVILGVIVYEAIFILIQNFLCKMEVTYNLGEKFSDLWAATETQRSFLYKQFGDALLRPYFKHLYKPLRNIQIKEKLIIVERRRYVISELEDLVMFGLYIIILYIVILANKDSITVHSKVVMEEVMNGEHTRSAAFADSESIQQVYEFINTTFIPSIQPLRWYGNYVISDPAMMIDMSNKYIGVARLRQHRIKANVCEVAEPLKFLNVSCRPEISLGLTDTKAFGYGWGKVSTYLHLDRLRNIWRYASDFKTGTFGFIGEFAVYTGGGYVVYLGRTLHNSYANFRKLVEKLWIDNRTRSLFIEFLTYNVNCNVFNSVRLLFEQSATGYTIKNVNVNAVKMLFVNNEVENITVIFFALFIIWVGMLFFKQSLGVVKKIRTFYRDVWFVIDCIIILMSMICIGLFALRMKMIGQYLETMEKVKHNEFLNYFYLFYLEDFLKTFASILVCLATVRLWKFLRFGMMFRILERTLSISAAPLLTITLVFFVLIVGFACTIVLLYGNYFQNIDTVLRLMRLLVTMALKASEVQMSNYVQYTSGVFYLTLYGFLVKIVFLIYIMIIVMAYSEAQMEFSGETSGYTIKHYVQERIKYIPQFIKYKYSRMKAGERNYIEPKSDKFVYSNSLSARTSRLLVMKYITQKCIRKMTRPYSKSPILTIYDLELMLGVSHLFFLKTGDTEDVEVFFKGRIKGARIALIDEKRVLKIAQIVELMMHKGRRSELKTTTSRVKLQDCVTMIKKNQETLKSCKLILKLTLHKMDSAELELSKKFY